MKKREGKTPICALMTFAIMLVAILAVLFTSSLFPLNKMFPPQTTENLFLVKTLLSLTILGFSAYLIFIYLKDYMELKSNFTLALLLAIIAFMFFALTSNPWIHAACGVITYSDIFSIVPMAFAAIAMAILAWVSSK